MIISEKKVRARFWGVRTDQLWLLAVLICFALIVSLMPLPPNDFWWHLKVGELIYETGDVPRTSMYSWSISPDTPYFYGAWLAEYLFYLLYLVGKIPLIIFTRTLLTIAAFALVSTEALRKSGSWRIAGFVIMLAAAMSSNNVVIRPQIFAWIPFALYYIILNRYVDRKINRWWLIALPVLMTFWVNIHGSFIVGLVLVGVYFTGELLQYLFKKENALTLPELGFLGGTGVLSGLACLVNPRFLGIFWYVINMMTDKSSQELVGEWQSPTPEDYTGIIFFASILILILIFAYSQYKPTITEMLLMAAFLWLALTGIRYVVWFGLLSMPILGRAISAMLKDKSWMAIHKPNVLNVVIIVLLLVPVVLVQPWFIEKLPLPEGYQKFVLRGNTVGPMLTTHTPIDAVDYLRENPEEKLFNEMGFGSYLIWALPEQPVFADPRVELYPYDLWQDYIKITAGIRSIELLDQYGVERVMVTNNEQTELVLLLEKDPVWILQYQDEQVQIWDKGSQ